MNKNNIYRSRQVLFSKAQSLLPWHFPKLVSGNGCINQIPIQLKKDHIHNVLIAAPDFLIKSQPMNHFFNKMEEHNIRYTIFSDIQTDPDIDTIEKALSLYLQKNCQGIVAIGGGSVIDLAKVVGARIVKPKQSIPDMFGLLKIHKKLPPFYVAPTTAGSGSEVTIAAVIKDNNNKEKRTIQDTSLLPDFAYLDPALTLSLPASITAETGMDALTHAIEAYTNKYSSKQSQENAVKATKLIFDNLEKVYFDGHDIVSRENMLLAAHYAGLAFTRSYVGYVHAIAHSVGAIYGVPHGRANAVILPIVLESYGLSIEKNIQNLSTELGWQDTSIDYLIQRINQLNQNMNLPKHLTMIQEKDIPKIAKSALREGNPDYPVPEIWDYSKFVEVILKIKG